MKSHFKKDDLAFGSQHGGMPVLGEDCGLNEIDDDDLDMLLDDLKDVLYEEDIEDDSD